MRPTVFDWLQDGGGISHSEMLRTFNCGIGMVVVASPEQCPALTAAAEQLGWSPAVIGEVVVADGSERIRYLES